MSFDKSMLEANVRAIAAQFPDQIYHGDLSSTGPSCVYVRNGEPDCLIGRAAHLAGMSIDELSAFDREVEDSGAEYVFEPYGFTTIELAWLKRVQQLQDKGFMWGEAVRMADEGELIP